MSVAIREYCSEDVQKAVEIWNEVVRAGNAFPQLELLDEKTGDEFFRSQSYTGIAAEESGEIVGLYISSPE